MINSIENENVVAIKYLFNKVLTMIFIMYKADL